MASISPFATAALTLVITLFLTARLAIALDFDDQLTDTPFLNTRFRGRFLREDGKKGAHCNVTNTCQPTTKNELLFCCKKHCRNVHSDRNHCGTCERKCGFEQLCCSGKCVKVVSNVAHCGKCNNACEPGIKCESGVCGYAG